MSTQCHVAAASTRWAFREMSLATAVIPHKQESSSWIDTCGLALNCPQANLVQLETMYHIIRIVSGLC